MHWVSLGAILGVLGCPWELVLEISPQQQRCVAVAVAFALPAEGNPPPRRTREHVMVLCTAFDQVTNSLFRIFHCDLWVFFTAASTGRDTTYPVGHNAKARATRGVCASELGLVVVVNGTFHTNQSMSSPNAQMKSSSAAQPLVCLLYTSPSPRDS